MDYLPIQASAVPCECVFSSSTETNTHRWNQISPMLMEALQMLKFKLKKDSLNFTCGTFTRQCELLEDDPDEPEHNTRLSHRDELHRLFKKADDEEKEISDDVELLWPFPFDTSVELV